MNKLIFIAGLITLNCAYANDGIKIPNQPLENTLCIVRDDGKKDCKNITPEATKVITSINKNLPVEKPSNASYKGIETPVYKYRDAAGQWIYSDQAPKTTKSEKLDLRSQKMTEKFSVYSN